MGNNISELAEHLYILKMVNNDLPLVPFIHTITKYNGQQIKSTDPRIFKEILAASSLILEIMDVRDRSTFTIEIPQGTEKLGINVVKVKGNVHPLRIRLLSARQDGPFMIDDQILGIENVFLESEDEFVRCLKTRKGENIQLIVARGGSVLSVSVDVEDDLGCEIGTGLFYQIDGKDYYMNGYNSKVVRVIKDKKQIGAVVDNIKGIEISKDVPHPPAEYNLGTKEESTIRKNELADDEVTKNNVVESKASNVEEESEKNESAQVIERDPEEIQSCAHVEHNACASDDLMVNDPTNYGKGEGLHGMQPVNKSGAVVLENGFVPADSLVRKEDGMQIDREAFDGAEEKEENKAGTIASSLEEHFSQLVFSEEEGPDLFPGVSAPKKNEEPNKMLIEFDDDDKGDFLFQKK